VGSLGIPFRVTFLLFDVDRTSKRVVFGLRGGGRSRGEVEADTIKCGYFRYTLRGLGS